MIFVITGNYELLELAAMTTWGSEWLQLGKKFELAKLFARGLTALKTVLGSCYTTLTLGKQRILTSVCNAHTSMGKTFEIFWLAMVRTAQPS